jgi:AAA15 family ATPase/GTPase
MLIEFTVGNHLSFKEKKTLSLEAAPIKEFEENVFQIADYDLLKSAVIYGANSSGKSNLIKSLSTMRDIVVDSSKMSSADKIAVKPFLLNIDTENAPSYFEILFFIDNIRYRYGFEVDEKEIHSEWLFQCKSKKESLLFIRDKDKIEITKDFIEGKGIEERTRENALFLSSVDQWNGAISKKIVRWFDEGIHILSGIKHEDRRSATTQFSKDSKPNAYMNLFIADFGLGFNEFQVDFNKNEKVVTHHNKYDKAGNVIGDQWFDLLTEESSGTNKVYDLAGHIMIGLLLGNLTIIDELDAKLHPLLTMSIVKLFNSSDHNPKNAQLIFATHDTNLLTYGAFRRDQIYFTEKNQFEETDLYSLVEYKNENGEKIRNDRSFEKDYINGRYGAIPFIGDFSNLITDGQGS